MRLEVQTESDKVAALRAEVKTYEQRLKEALERKVLAKAEGMAAKMAQAAQEEEEEEKEEEEDETRNFTMLTGSDDEQEEDDEEEEARVVNDLELSYEGLELLSIMPLPGVEFGRWTLSSPSGNKEWDRRGAGSRVWRACSGTSAGTGRTSIETTLPVTACRSQAKERGGGCSGCSCCGKALPVEHRKVDASSTFQCSMGKRFPAEAPTPKVSVVSGFTNFSPYAALRRKYTTLAV